MVYAQMNGGAPYHQSFGYDQVGRLTGVSTPLIDAPSQHTCTTSPGPNACTSPLTTLPPNTKIRPFATGTTYDEFGNVTGSGGTYWHDTPPGTTTPGTKNFDTTLVNGRAKKDGVAGKVYNTRDELWQYNNRGQVYADTRSVHNFDNGGQTTKTIFYGNTDELNYAYDGDGRMIKFLKKTGVTTITILEEKYRIYSSVLGGLLTEIGKDAGGAGKKLETKVYTLVDPHESWRQVKAYSVPNGGNPPLNVPDTLVYEGSDPYNTRAVVWDKNTNTPNKTVYMASGAYVEEINWATLKTSFVAGSNGNAQKAYGELAASQYISSYFSLVDPRNPGSGCSLDGKAEQCSKVIKAFNHGSAGFLYKPPPGLIVFRGTRTYSEDSEEREIVNEAGSYEILAGLDEFIEQGAAPSTPKAKKTPCDPGFFDEKSTNTIGGRNFTGADLNFAARVVYAESTPFGRYKDISNDAVTQERAAIASTMYNYMVEEGKNSTFSGFASSGKYNVVTTTKETGRFDRAAPGKFQDLSQGVVNSKGVFIPGECENLTDAVAIMRGMVADGPYYDFTRHRGNVTPNPNTLYKRKVLIGTFTYTVIGHSRFGYKGQFPEW